MLRFPSGNAALLNRKQACKIDNSRRHSFFYELTRSRFQLIPARQVIRWTSDDTMEQTPPFDQRSFDIAVTKQVADEFMLRSRISHEFTHHFRCAGAVRVGTPITR